MRPPGAPREAKNFIQASGNVDAAARAAREAENFENNKEFTEAVKWHDKAAKLYAQAAENLKQDNQSQATIATANDKELIISFDQLSKTHERQKKFLELRQKDPDSLFDVGDIRARLAPKRRALQDQKMREKGFIKGRQAKGSAERFD